MGPPPQERAAPSVARSLLNRSGGREGEKVTARVSKLLVGLTAGLFITTACQKPAAINEDVNADNVVEAGDVHTNQTIGDDANKFNVVGQCALARRAREKGFKLYSGPAADKIRAADESGACNEPGRNDDPTPIPGPGVDTSLLLGFPLDLVGEQQLFGGVVTAVSDKQSEDLGRLKLIDLPGLHAKTMVLKVSDTEYVLGLMGCVRNCSEISEQVPLLTIPIVGVDESKKVVVLDLAALGNELNLIQMLDPTGEYTKLKTKSSKTVSFDYSISTLVFDVEVTMIPLDADPTATGVPETKFTVRWYMKLGSGFNPAFDSRPAADGVGFFMTERSASSKITRFSRFITGGGVSPTGSVHYFVKNVPAEHQAAFKASFDGWNKEFVAATGVPLLTYELIAADDPRAKLLVAGDIRYNIVEWDLVNAAPYGGLGPSIANQFSGETISGNVLVQGPKIMELYTKWFGANRNAAELREEGRVMEADVLIARAAREIRNRVGASKVAKPFQLKLGKLEFRIPAQMEAYQDPLFAQEEFEEIPAGVTFQTYMRGYFEELVSHELGHNLGLRHNFRGNLSAAPELVAGGVSHSIMEYLGRGFRHLNAIGSYDIMAIKYGYLGVKPDKLGLFCTDEDVAAVDNPAGSPECSRDDATADPFGFFEKRLQRSIDLLIARGSAAAPSFELKDVETPLTAAVTGLGLYAARAEATGSKWTNFFTGGDRPTSVAEVRGYTIAKLKAKLCDPTIGQVIEAKQSAEAKEKAQANLKALSLKVEALVTPLQAITAAELSCGS